jgi:hypothetical protein
MKSPKMQMGASCTDRLSIPLLLTLSLYTDLKISVQPTWAGYLSRYTDQVTVWTTEESVFDSRRGGVFSLRSRVHTRTRVAPSPGEFFVADGWGLQPNTHHHLLPKLRMLTLHLYFPIQQSCHRPCQLNQNFLYHTTFVLFGITHRKHGTGYLGFFAFLQLTQPTIFRGIGKKLHACLVIRHVGWCRGC